MHSLLFRRMAVALSFNRCDSELTGNGNLLGENLDIVVAFPLSRGLRTDIQDHRRCVFGGVQREQRKKRGGGDELSINRVEKEKGRKGSEAESVFTRRESHTSS